MGKRGTKRKQRKAAAATGAVPPGTLTVDRKNRSGHYKGGSYSDVYREGKAYVYTAWNDNEEEVGAEMDFDAWRKTYSKKR